MLVVNRNSGADGSSLAFFDHVHTTYACLFSSSEKRTLLDLRHFGQHAHYCATAKVRGTAACFSDEVVQHRPRSLKIGNDAVNQRSDDSDIARLTPLHLVRFVADRDNFACDLVDCDYRGLVNYNTAAADGDDRARRAHIDRHRIGDEVSQRVEAEERAGFTDERHKITMARMTRSPFANQLPKDSPAAAGS